MIRGLLNIKNQYGTNAARYLSQIPVLEEKRKEKSNDLSELYGIVNSLLSMAQMKAMKNSAMEKNVESFKNMPKGYRAEKTSLFERIFGDPYRFYKDDTEIPYMNYMQAGYESLYGGE